MLPKKELYDLARAIQATPEYTQMITQRRLIMHNQRLGRLMQSFEKEQVRIMNRNTPEDQVADQIRRLYNDYKELLENDDMKAYLRATQSYQNMVGSYIDYLNSLLDPGNA